MDAYDRKARLYPAGAVVSPLAVLALTLFSLPSWWSGLVGFAVAGGLLVPVTHAVRDLGVRQQERLWRTWGGPPTTRRLRWAGASNGVLHARHHADIAKATGIALPSREEEATDPIAADEVYETAVSILRERTRGADFPLVQAEIANYGYRRNLYGCRVAGIAVASGCAVAQGAIAVLSARDVVNAQPEWAIAGLIVSALATVSWWCLVTPAFVERDANRYADSLIAAATTLAAKI